ncbi:hypothetical protein Gotur_016058, partial [Gossypium turneri]
DSSLRHRTGTVVKLISPSSFSEQRRLSGETCIAVHGKIRPLKTWVHIFEPKLQSRASKFEYMLNKQKERKSKNWNKFQEPQGLRHCTRSGHTAEFDPEEGFAKVKKYGLPQDEGVKSFISNPTAQLSERVVLVMMSKATNEVLERREVEF